MFAIISYIIFFGAAIAVQCISASTQASATYDTYNDESSHTMIVEEEYLNKHESLKTCFSFDLEPDEYVMFPNKTAYVPTYNKTYEEEHYILLGSNIRICAPSEVFEETPSQLTTVALHYISIIGIGVSLVFLLLHIIVFAVVPDLQNLPGYNLASLCLSLFLSYLFMLLGTQESVFRNNLACTAVAVLTQFFFLGSFLWMFVMAFDLFRSILNATENLRVSMKGFKPKKYICNSLISWGISLLFAAAALIADNVDGIDELYKPRFEEACWFRSKVSLLAFFAGPLFALIGVNFLLFGVTAYNIFSNRMKTGDSSNRAYLKKNYLTYLRLAVIMGVTWITGLIAPMLNVVWLWYLFAILNAFQGVFIFIAFTCTNKVKKYFKSNLLNIRRPSEQTLTAPTFQSYCFYANSIEKDLDKFVENKDKSNHVDTIVIHL
ncbi:unnamed protein product [Larinioides sclopetarius]|uniref:G-protein coupled receptors family 2 profile 2 domain-containing protein n=1 Tax=Larinioides sclopetarius TaxID=280406 RepID=A0AAV2AHA8_9ARAC